jgi:hypothetical protein
VDADGSLDCGGEDLDVLIDFDCWRHSAACDHEGGYLVAHHIGNIVLVASLRKELGQWPERFRMTLSRVAYNGIHSGVAHTRGGKTMIVRIEGSLEFGPTSEERLATFEATHQFKLPPDYRRFLLNHNGGRPRPGCVNFRYRNRETACCVHYFYGLHDGAAWAQLERAAEICAGRMPDGFLPIGPDPGGNQFVLTTSGPDAGAIFFWEHEYEADEGEPPSTENLWRLASSFDELLERMAEFTEPSAGQA